MPQPKPDAAPVAFSLNGARVTLGFREAIFAASDRAGISANEFCILAAAEKLVRRGVDFPGVFRSGDIDFFRERAGS